MNEQGPGAQSILLVSCYELGHQPAGIAMPMGLLRRAGYGAETMDVSVEGFDADKVKRARFVGISVAMHTALRLGLRVAQEVRKLNPECHICFYGLYAALNSDYLLNSVADSVIGGEFEEALVQLIKAVQAGAPIDVKEVSTRSRASKPVLARLTFAAPDRRALVPLEHYAKLEYNGEQRLVGYVEASRGCLHHCTHCPIPSVYNGRFFGVPEEIVLDIRFGSRARCTKSFRNSAVESLSNTVLEHLDKGHTRDDVIEALRILRSAGIVMRPTFVSFTPWATIDDYIDVLEFVESQQLIDHVDPVQYSIRLLVPPGSLLLSQPDSHQWIGRLVQESFSYEWEHPDPRMDELHRRVSALVEQAAGSSEDAAETFYTILELAHAGRGGAHTGGVALPVDPSRLRPPRLTEAWFC